MIVLPTTRRRSEELAGALDARGALDLDSVAASRPAAGAPAYDDARLVALARALPRPAVAMDPQRRAEIRARLVAVAAVGGAVPPATPTAEPTLDLLGWLRRELGRREVRTRLALSGIAAALVLVVGFAVSVAGSRSLPGEPFYAVKRAAETVQLDMTHGKVARGRLHFTFAATRLQEVRGLLQHDNGTAAAISGATADGYALRPRTVTLVRETLTAMDGETLAGTRDLTEAWRDSGDSGPLQLLHGHSAVQFTQLAALVPDLPVAARTSAEQSLALLAYEGTRAVALHRMTDCDAACRSRATAETNAVPTTALAPMVCAATCTDPAGPAAGWPASPTTPATPPGSGSPVPPAGPDSVTTSGTTSGSPAGSPSQVVPGPPSDTLPPDPATGQPSSEGTVPSPTSSDQGVPSPSAAPGTDPPPTVVPSDPPPDPTSTSPSDPPSASSSATPPATDTPPATETPPATDTPPVSPTAELSPPATSSPVPSSVSPAVTSSESSASAAAPPGVDRDDSNRRPDRAAPDR